MTVDWQRLLPVIVSILIIILVAILRQHSRTLAAITATMPINIPLALWIVYQGEGGDKAALADFSHTAFYGIFPTVIFIAIAYLTARAGWNFVPMLLAGYAGWAVSLLVIMAARGALGR
jgi:hypothetical protein